MTNVTSTRTDVLDDEDFDDLLARANEIFKDNEYFRLRARSIVALGRTGKRRSEVARLGMNDIRVEGEWLYISFTVSKKRKKSPIALIRTKRFSLKSPWAQILLEYKDYMKAHHPECKFLFPSAKNIFGVSLLFYADKHLTGKQVYVVLKQLNPQLWFHLFRESRGAEIVKQDEKRLGEASILSVYRVKRALDLENEATAWRYINRYATETVEEEQEEIA